ncbi:hypothetical protein FHG87_009541 [Trinorchestia longiramus]|nr:hypothetical protein FHG87_009541 [Trinorchestia longiramus]
MDSYDIKDLKRATYTHNRCSVSPPSPDTVTPPSGSPYVSNTPCVCDREPKLIHCRFCGPVGYGRMKIVCTRHPKSIYLMDFVACPRCRSPSDSCLSEIVMPSTKPL